MTTPQHWRCAHCPAVYDSPLPLRRPPAHWCHPAGGRRRLRDFTLEAVCTVPVPYDEADDGTFLLTNCGHPRPCPQHEPPPKPAKAADGDSYETRLADNSDFDPFGIERFP